MNTSIFRQSIGVRIKSGSVLKEMSIREKYEICLSLLLMSSMHAIIDVYL